MIEKKVSVNTTIPAEKYDLIKSKGLKFNEILLIGIDAKIKIDFLEAENNRLSEKIQELAKRIFELEQKNG